MHGSVHGGTTRTATAEAACQLSQPLLTWQHNNNCHVCTCHSCCELIDTDTLSMHRSTVVARRRFLLPAYTRVTNFCQTFGCGNGDRLMHGMAYTWVCTVSKISSHLVWSESKTQKRTNSELINLFLRSVWEMLHSWLVDDDDAVCVLMTSKVHISVCFISTWTLLCFIVANDVVD